MSRIVLPTNDLAFKKLFASQEHPEIIQGFLADILGLKVDVNDIVIKNPYSIESYLEEHQARNEQTQVKFRETIRDITIAIIDTADVTIEMQLEKPDYFQKRLHYYVDDLYLSNYNKAITGNVSRYDSMKPVISLNITDFNIFPDNHPLRTFSYRDNQTFKLLEPVYKTIGFLELRKNLAGFDNLTAWQQFFRTGQVNHTAPNYLLEAARIINYHNLSPKERAMVDARQKEIDTSLAILHRAVREGKEQGRAEGIAEGLAKGLSEGKVEGLTEGARLREIEIAKEALAQGLSPEMATRLTGLSLAEVKSLQTNP